MIQFNNIDELINWVNHQKKFTNTPPTLTKMKTLMSYFGHPEEHLPAIHVAGTNGKGSTVAYLKNIYLKKGLNVATFTSPYVTCFNERINYNNKNISNEDLLRIGNLVLSKYELLKKQGFEEPTFFEFITSVCFIYFNELKDLDICIIECGMGGRLDATNIITPLCSVITNIGFDHMNILGNTKELILKEKLGIVKPNIPFVTSIKEENLLNIIYEYIKNKNIIFSKPLYERLKINKIDIYSSNFSYEDKTYDINLPGDYQIDNAILAIECVKILNNFEKSKYYISNELLYESLKNTTWPGRFEKISTTPLIYLDGGHNIDCIEKVTNFIKQLNLSNTRAIVSISDDKLKEQMIKKLDQTFDEIIFTSYSYSRSANAVELYNLSHNPNKLLIENINQAINYVYEKPYTFNGQKIKAQIWDTAGQERYRNITKNYFQSSQGFVIAYDITNKTSFECVEEWIKAIDENASSDCKKILVGTKCDKEGREVTEDEGKDLADKYGMKFFETSAKTNINISEVFNSLVKEIHTKALQNDNNMESLMNTKSYQIQQEDDEEKKEMKKRRPAFSK